MAILLDKTCNIVQLSLVLLQQGIQGISFYISGGKLSHKKLLRLEPITDSVRLF